ncbi:anthranilate synthase family protein [Rhodococcus sp. G-MC3]|uniref:anthranilate synthase family protein n=1 Tax=Rhodococcus sp. G-MC3 TaxID=3046209 RepID=UPI0024B89098|nr:anthranilate synthase family protein [Rhodococcus sp. G-MC3]MDJ0394417.1 anthranilate synthase family protein [Rhodococcus sp. G-MC3]
MNELLTRALTGSEPFAVLSREGGVDVLLGEVITVDSLADIPLDAAASGPDVLALVPFRQVTERGFVCHDDESPLQCLRVREHVRLSIDEVLAALPVGALNVTDGRFEPEDDAYASIVSRVLTEEIGTGAGANFVIRRDFRASLDDSLTSGLEIFRRLLLGESGSYWTFFVSTPTVTLVGATPERHVGFDGTSAIMNPISGTYRHPVEGPSGVGVLDFLGDAKENAELFMVVDEELKMMSRICAHGGRVIGPKLKQMGHLTHTEYILVGETDMDPRDILRETMFAPTVTGSPIENAARVIERYETSGRGYYSGVLALFEHSDGVSTVDAPILIRTCEIAPSGELKISAGATLVRNSVPEHEVAETRSKLGGVLAAVGVEAPRPRAADAVRLDEFPGVAEALARRNEKLAEFWLDQQPLPSTSLLGRTAVVVDFEDQWTAMIAHQLRHLGMDVSVVRWENFAGSDAELLVCGPGPGDPSVRDARILAVENAVDGRLASGSALLAICLSHQVLARRLGLDVVALESPTQGVQRTVRVFGEERTVGFYNTFTALDGPIDGVVVSVDGGHVNALRGSGFESVQFHPESVLSTDGLEILSGVVHRLLRVSADVAVPLTRRSLSPGDDATERRCASSPPSPMLQPRAEQPSARPQRCCSDR